MEMTMSTMNLELTPEQKALPSKMMHNVLRDTTVIMALNVPITSIGTFIAYRKFRNTYAEHLVANAYLYGLLSSISVFTIWFTSLPGLMVATTIFANFATLFFNIWFFKSWYQTNWLNAIWRSILGFVLSLLIIAVLANVFTFVLMKTGLLPKPGEH
ncbi:MAG: hypothetical protein IT258_20110, partial [Saprospiraceae bacterium]|nr:hypothetical protein [Saprospiraceae bacterium]